MSSNPRSVGRAALTRRVLARPPWANSEGGLTSKSLFIVFAPVKASGGGMRESVRDEGYETLTVVCIIAVENASSVCDSRHYICAQHYMKLKPSPIATPSSSFFVSGLR